MQATYRDNYQRLAEIKKKYDPTNFFRVNQNIHPAACVYAANLRSSMLWRFLPCYSHSALSYWAYEFVKFLSHRRRLYARCDMY